jgi:hypothetical protein
MAKPRPITRWNLLALAAVVIGTAVTLGLDHWWLGQWINSGQSIPLGQRSIIPLNAGRVIVHYESTDTVPLSSMVHLHVLSPSGESVEVMPARDMSDYNIARFGRSGRTMWEVFVIESGLHDVGGYNHHHASDREIPADDRIVFGRSPAHLNEAMRIRDRIRYTGLVVTLSLTVLLYGMHIYALRRRSAVAAATSVRADDNETEERSEEHHEGR